MALLVEGLAVCEPSIKEYVVGPVDEIDEDHIKLYGPDEGLSWKPLQPNLTAREHYGSSGDTFGQCAREATGGGEYE